MEKMHILVVEDDPIIAADLTDRLLQMGCAVLGPVASGELALAFFGQGPPPDLALMDIQLEGPLDGIGTVRRIRETCPHLPVIFLTSNSDDATFALAKAVHPQAFLSKPFRGRDLAHAIDLALRQSASERTPAAPTEEGTFLLHDRLFVKVNERMVRIFLKDILWVEADDYYSKIVTREKSFLVGQTLKKLHEALAGMPDLMRVHRSWIVNLQHIEAIGETFLFINKQEVPLSKTAKSELMARLHKI